jgi:hypothetical protein
MPYEDHRTGHSFLSFWGWKVLTLTGLVDLYYGAGVSYSEMGSLAGTDTELDIHPPQKTLCRTVRLSTRTVRLRARTVRPCGRTVRHYIRTIWRHTRTV